jgi:hypothetical protein
MSLIPNGMSKPRAAGSGAFLRLAFAAICGLAWLAQPACRNDQKIIDRHQQVLDEEKE